MREVTFAALLILIFLLGLVFGGKLANRIQSDEPSMRAVYLEDGTKCVIYGSCGITCDWQGEKGLRFHDTAKED